MTTYVHRRWRPGDGALIRKRVKLRPAGFEEDVDGALERFAIAVDEIRANYVLEDVNVVMDVYVTPHPDPLADDDHHIIGFED